MLTDAPNNQSNTSRALLTSAERRIEQEIFPLALAFERK